MGCKGAYNGSLKQISLLYITCGRSWGYMALSYIDDFLVAPGMGKDGWCEGNRRYGGPDG